MTTYLFDGQQAVIDKQTTSNTVRTSNSHDKYMLTSDRTGLFLACGDIADVDLMFSIVKGKPHSCESDYFGYLMEMLKDFNKQRKDMGSDDKSNCDVMALFCNSDGECEAFSIFDMCSIERVQLEERSIYGSGSGYQLARGAYYVRGRMRDAMNIASWRDIYTCGTWDTFEVQMSMETAHFEFVHKVVQVSVEPIYDSMRKVLDRETMDGLTREELDEFEDAFVARFREAGVKTNKDMREYFCPPDDEDELSDDHSSNYGARYVPSTFLNDYTIIENPAIEHFGGIRTDKGFIFNWSEMQLIISIMESAKHEDLFNFKGSNFQNAITIMNDEEFAYAKAIVFGTADEFHRRNDESKECEFSRNVALRSYGGEDGTAEE